MTPEQFAQLGTAGVTVALLVVILKALWDEFKYLLRRTLDEKDYEISKLQVENDRMKAQIENLANGGQPATASITSMRIVDRVRPALDDLPSKNDPLPMDSGRPFRSGGGDRSRGNSPDALTPSAA